MNQWENAACMARGKSHLYQLAETALNRSYVNRRRARRRIKTVQWWQGATLEKQHVSPLANVLLKPICRAPSSHLKHVNEKSVQLHAPQKKNSRRPPQRCCNYRRSWQFPLRHPLQPGEWHRPLRHPSLHSQHLYIVKEKCFSEPTPPHPPPPFFSDHIISCTP